MKTINTVVKPKIYTASTDDEIISLFKNFNDKIEEANKTHGLDMYTHPRIVDLFDTAGNENMVAYIVTDGKNIAVLTTFDREDYLGVDGLDSTGGRLGIQLMENLVATTSKDILLLTGDDAGLVQYYERFGFVVDVREYNDDEEYEVEDTYVSMCLLRNNLEGGN